MNQNSEHHRKHELSGFTHAALLLLPSLVIVCLCFVILPWLFDLRSQLQNGFWERQVLLAIVSFSISGTGVFFVGLRLFRMPSLITQCGWIIISFGYLMLTIYVLQSHIPFAPRVIFAVFGLLFLFIATRGFFTDKKSIKNGKK